MRYANDPRTINLKWPGKCACCGRDMAKGEEAFYFPKSRKMQCFVTPKCAADNEKCLDAMAAEDGVMRY